MMVGGDNHDSPGGFDYLGIRHCIIMQQKVDALSSLYFTAYFFLLHETPLFCTTIEVSARHKFVCEMTISENRFLV